MVDVKDSGLPAAPQALADADIVALTQNVGGTLTTVRSTLTAQAAHVLNGTHPLTGHWTVGAFNISTTGTLSVSPDTGVVTTLGRFKLGDVAADTATIAHFDQFTATGYAFKQNSLGDTRFNCADQRVFDLRANDNTYGRFNHAELRWAFGANIASDMANTFGIQALNVGDHTQINRAIASQTGDIFRAENSSGSPIWRLSPLAGATPAGNETSMTLSSTWAPTSTAFTFTQLNISPTINQTGTATGTYVGLAVEVTETAYLGSASGSSLLRVALGGSARFSVIRNGEVFANQGAYRNQIDSKGYYTGASDDLRMYHDGTNSHLLNITGDLILTAPAGELILSVITGTGTISSVSASGLQMTVGYVKTSTDNSGFYSGASDDVRLYHNGTDTIIDNNTGQLVLDNVSRIRLNQSNTSGAAPVLELDQDDTDQPMIDFDGNIAADATASISSRTVPGSISHFAQVTIEGVGKRWIALYNDPTA